MRSFASERAIGIPCRQQELIAQPFGIVSGKSERGGEHAGFVLAFFMDGIKRIVAKLCYVHESVFGIGGSVQQSRQRGDPGLGLHDRLRCFRVLLPSRQPHDTGKRSRDHNAGVG